MMNKQISKENWKSLKAELRAAWDELSMEEIESTHGSIKAIFGLVQQKCELHEEEVKSKLMTLLKKYEYPPTRFQKIS
ncbi:hypothetical protein [Bdellovibrio bacteriovorus]|uniref:General stress protein CsbD n=1 Tax=Bdellovibrio bacteriovorus str. Tiberius TaxID=1069642 RepID=K7YTP6_BDEBC|nr:hypothetical protein [Bdellovibrio bacteriovorus]AFX99959.1 Hypothetical protein Bdt_0251 [Bdellovibrio bacteriovorus str. Tiberius]